MAWPIVTVSSGGIPVTEAANGFGTPVEIAANGFGTPVTIVAAGGIPVVGSGGGGPASYTLQAGAGVFTITGEDMTPVIDYRLPAGTGVFTIAGQNADLIVTPGGSPPVLTYIVPQTSPISPAGTASATGVSIGTAAADRLVVVVSTSISNVNGPATLAKIGGVTADIIDQDDRGGSNVCIFQRLVPSGATADIDLTFATSSGFTVFDVYTITGLSSTTPVGFNHNGSNSASVASTTLATSAGGVMIVGSVQYTGGSTTDVLTGTEAPFTADQNSFPIFGSCCGTTASKSGTAANAASSVTATWNGAANSCSLVAVAWR